MHFSPKFLRKDGLEAELTTPDNLLWNKSKSAD